MYLKKNKKLVIGFLLVVLCILPAGVLASTSARVAALLDGDIAFLFDGQREVLPLGYNVLLYENHTYVPARFVAERLGAVVGWDQITKTVKISTGSSAEYLALQKEKEGLEKTVKEQDEKIKALEKEIKDLKARAGERETSAEGQPAGSYQKLPLARVLTALNIRVTGLFQDDHYTRVYLELENKKPVPLQLLQAKTKAIVDGETYKTADILHFALDERWYHDIAEEETKDGYVMLPPLPKDAKEMLLELTILYNDAKQETTTLEFAIRLDS